MRLFFLMILFIGFVFDTYSNSITEKKERIELLKHFPGANKKLTYLRGKYLTEQLTKSSIDISEAFEFVEKLATTDRQSLTVEDIQKINELILKDIRVTAGKFRKISIKGLPCSAEPADISEQMIQFISWLKSTKDLDPTTIAAEAHWRLVNIHPFYDGNGRTARLLLNLILMQEKLPPISIPVEDEKYYSCLMEVISANDILCKVLTNKKSQAAKRQYSQYKSNWYEYVYQQVSKTLDEYIDILGT